MNDDELLHDLYYNKHNYGGLEQLYKKAKLIHPKIKKAFVSDWLTSQTAKQQTEKITVGKKSFLPIYSEVPYSFQIDLTFFPRYAKQNDNNTVLFTAININSRYVYAYYGKDKSMTTILDFLKKMEKKTVINSITCDEGTEFNNSEFIDFCKENGITLYFVKDDSHKLGIINRFHRTLKDKIKQFFIASNSLRWIDAIDDIINNYNHNVNRGIGKAPAEVNNFIEASIINEKREQTAIIKLKENSESNIKLNDFIRVAKKKKLFDDKMTPNYGQEIYQVVKVKNNSYLVIDDKGNEQKVKKSDALLIPTEDKNVVIPDLLAEAKKENKIKRKLKKEDIKIENIINDRPKRTIKKPSKYDN